LALEARTLSVERIAKHNIACDLRVNGHLTVAAKPAICAGCGKKSETLERVMHTRTRAC
jgi:hypothetical protein